jgi:hypothetical protein
MAVSPTYHLFLISCFALTELFGLGSSSRFFSVSVTAGYSVYKLYLYRSKSTLFSLKLVHRSQYNTMGEAREHIRKQVDDAHTAQYKHRVYAVSVTPCQR